MNIPKISNTSFGGSIFVNGDIKVFYKGEKLQTKTQLAKSGKILKNLFNGSFAKDIDLDTIKVRHAPSSDIFTMTGLVEVDTDRIAAITPTDIELRSQDDSTVGFIAYNKDNNPIRQLLLVNAYNAAADKDIAIEID